MIDRSTLEHTYQMVEDVETDDHVRVDVDCLDLADSTPSNDVDAATILSSPPSSSKNHPPISSFVRRHKKLLTLVAVIASLIVATRYASGGSSAAIGTTDVDDVGVATYNVSEGLE